MKITENVLRSIIKNIIKEQSDINPRDDKTSQQDLQQRYSVDLIKTLKRCKTLTDIHAQMKADGYSEEDFNNNDESYSYQYFWNLRISVIESLYDLQSEGYKVGFVIKTNADSRMGSRYTVVANQPSSGEDFCAILLR